jgi:hypothetical protein
LPSQRWTTGILFIFEGELWWSRHYAQPFGFLGAVYSWERLANFLWFVICSMLRLPLCKYVDDYFGVESEAMMERTLHYVAMVFTAILGQGSLSPKKLQVGNPLTILGFDVTLAHNHVLFQLNETKRCAWLEQIRGFRLCGKMSQDDAAQMSGRLSFASEFLFRRLGRAMLRPLFAQKGTRDGLVHGNLQEALGWWETALEWHDAEEHWLEDNSGISAEMFCDASGEPGHLCAVLFINGAAFYCHSEVPECWWNFFVERNDAQIMALELLAIYYGLMAFMPLLRGRTIRVWTDNEGCRGSMSSGAASAVDHNKIVHWIWEACFGGCVNPWFDRVPSDDNVSDGPTRKDLRVVEALGCCFISAHVPPVK